MFQEETNVLNKGESNFDQNNHDYDLPHLSSSSENVRFWGEGS